MTEFWPTLRTEYIIDPALNRPARGVATPSWYRGNVNPDVLFIADNPSRLTGHLHREMMEMHGLEEISGTTFLCKYPGYLTGPERAASARYVQDELIHVQPKVIVALGNDPLKFCLRWDDTSKVPPVSVCHGQRFSTPKGKPVIAGLPPTPVFHRRRVTLAYEAAAYTLRNIDNLEFA